MEQIKCSDCGVRVPDEHLEIDENVRTLIFKMKRGGAWRALCITPTAHESHPELPLTDGTDIALCLGCTIKSLQAVTIAEPVAVGCG